METGESAGRDRGGFAPSRRRDVSLKLRDVRERLTSSNGLRQAFDVEMIRQFAQSRLSATLAVAVMVTAVAFAASLWGNRVLLAIWWMTCFSTQATMVTLSSRFLDMSGGPIISRIWRRRFALAEGLNALAWVILAVQLWMVGADAARYFVLFLMMLVVAMATILSATLPAVMYVGAVPISLVVVGLAIASGNAAMTAMAMMALGTAVYFMILGHRLHDFTVETLEFRAEKDSLITELEQAKANSDEARRRAEEANLAKSRFLATMSHELRTPLNAILGFSEVMKSEVFGPLNIPTYKEYVADIHASGQHLLNLINEILDLSRIEAGRYELKEEAVHLVHLVDECQHLLKLRAKAKGIKVHQVFESGMPAIWADERAVRQIALNLLSNAIKFTPQGGEVFLKVGWTSAGGQYLLIADTGPGIPEEEIPTVLASFGRGSLAIKTAEQGTGLGLPIVKGLVDLHGGKFSLRSKLREGTEVTVIFPAERVMEALPPIVDGKPARRARAA